MTSAPEPVATVLQDEEQPKGWHGGVTAMFSTTDGNTRVEKGSLIADALLERDKDEWKFGLNWFFSEQTELINGNQVTVLQRYAIANGQYNRDITDDTYWLAQASLNTDEQAFVDLRTTIGAGIGHKFAESDTWEFNGEAGVSYFDEDFAPGAGIDNDYIAARLAYNWKRTAEKWSLSQATVVFPSLEDGDDIYANVDTRATYNLSEAMYAQFQWLFYWDNTPAVQPATGLPLRRVDNLYTITVGWQF